jgi:hypothetical protein
MPGTTREFLPKRPHLEWGSLRSPPPFGGSFPKVTTMSLIIFKIRSQGLGSLSVESYAWSLIVISLSRFPSNRVIFPSGWRVVFHNPTGFVMSQNHGHTEHKAELPVQVEGRHECSMLKVMNMTTRSVTHSVLHSRTPRPRVWTPKRNMRTCSHFYRVCVGICRCSTVPVHYEYYQISTNTKMKTWAALRCHSVYAVLMIRFLL